MLNNIQIIFFEHITNETPPIGISLSKRHSIKNYHINLFDKTLTLLLSCNFFTALKCKDTNMI